MNSLSWMIYLADVTGGLSKLTAFLAFACGASGLGSFIGMLTTVGEPHIWSWERDKADTKIADHKRLHLMFKGVIPKALLGMACFAAVSAILPSQGTVYAIAASEMGEQVIQSKTAGKEMQALDAWLDRQITPEQSK